jgi:hypothetical protein
MHSSEIAISFVAIMLFGVVTPASTQQAKSGAGGELFEKVQLEFAEAYNRKDFAAIAAFFIETEFV